MEAIVLKVQIARICFIFDS
jgi:hypothetical protein